MILLCKLQVTRTGGPCPTADGDPPPPSARTGEWPYPYRIFPANLPLFFPELRSHRLVSQIRLSVLGRTYGTYLHYERSYSINIFFIRRFGQPRLWFDLRAKASDSREISPRFRGNFPAIPGKFPRDSWEISPVIFMGKWHNELTVFMLQMR